MAKKNSFPLDDTDWRLKPNTSSKDSERMSLTEEDFDRCILSVMKLFDSDDDSSEETSAPATPWTPALIPKNQAGPYDVFGGLGLQVDPDSNWPCDDTLTGQITRIAGSYFFSLYDLRSSAIVAHNARIIPLLDFFSKDHTPLKIQLTQDDSGDVYILDLRIEGLKKDSETPYQLFLELDNEQSLLRHVILRLLTHNTKQRISLPKQSCNYTSFHQLKFIFETLKEQLPPQLKDWAQAIFNRFDNILRLEQHRSNHFRSSSHIGGMDKDEERQLLRALSLVLSVDWTIQAPQVPPDGEIQQFLNENIFGLESVKTRILEIAAQLRHCGKFPQKGILLSGPPGVGKTFFLTLLGLVLNMPVLVLNMSILHDGDAIAGSSKIYSNSRHGKVVDGCHHEQTGNLLVIIEEIDKATPNNFVGCSNPQDTLLTLLEKKGYFLDQFIDAPIPCDGMFFVATCNDVRNITEPLRDRFQVIEIPPYTAEEKATILRNFILPKELEDKCLPKHSVSFSDDALTLLCREYSRGGVRDLLEHTDRFIPHFIRKMQLEGIEHLQYRPEDVRQLLGPSCVIKQQFLSAPGMALTAFTHHGQIHVLPVEAVAIPGAGQFSTLNITNQTIKDYCRTAYLTVRHMVPSLNKQDISVFIPQNIPSDVTQNFIGMATAVAIVSAVCGQDLSNDTAYLGGCDLLGNTYLEDFSLSPYMNAFSEYRIKRLYVPLGSSKTIHTSCSGSIDIIEGINMSVILELVAHALSQNNTGYNDSEYDFDMDD